VFNIGGVREVSILELAGEVLRILGSTSEIRLEPYETDFPRGFEDTRRRVPDVTRARDILGFEARVELADGLARTLEWCQQNYELAVPQ
jgi:UDP-glucose 4-epimerase